MHLCLYENKYKLPGKNQHEANEVCGVVYGYHEGTKEDVVEKELIKTTEVYPKASWA